MGHAIEFHSFSVNESKRTIQSCLNEISIADGDYHQPLPTIDFQESRCFDCYDEAKEYLERLDGYYAQTAVRYKKAKDFKPSAKLTALNKKAEKAGAEYWELEKKFHFVDHKSEYIGCKHCGSKIALKYLKSNACPVCYTDMRPETTRKRLEALKTKKNSLIEQCNALYREEQKKHSKNAEEMWLVRIEYHV